jgi:hypothetical protein
MRPLYPRKTKEHERRTCQRNQSASNPATFYQPSYEAGSKSDFKNQRQHPNLSQNDWLAKARRYFLTKHFVLNYFDFSYGFGNLSSYHRAQKSFSRILVCFLG